jgi:hypothetical protein
MPLRPLLKNKLLLQKHYHVNEFCIDEWPFWMFEENIKIVNELTDEEEQQRKSEESQQNKSTSLSNFNPGNIMSNFNSGLGNIPNFGS